LEKSSGCCLQDTSTITVTNFERLGRQWGIEEDIQGNVEELRARPHQPLNEKVYGNLPQRQGYCLSTPSSKGNIAPYLEVKMNINRLLSRREKDGSSHKRQKSRDKSSDKKVMCPEAYLFSFHSFLKEVPSISFCFLYFSGFPQAAWEKQAGC
jgi:hypothetical protein